jgi:hypothetical protein
MSDDANNVIVDEADVSETSDLTVKETVETVDQLKLLSEELESKKELIKQLRKYEKAQKEEKDLALAEQGKYKELYESSQQRIKDYEESLKNNSLDSAIKDAASKYNVKSLSTLQKIIDKSLVEFNDDNSVNVESINKIIEGLQKSDAILFELPSVNTPPLKVSSEDVSTLNYETELRKCTTQKQIEAVMAKYGKI